MKSKIKPLKAIFYIFLILSIYPISCFAQIDDAVAIPDTAKQDTVLVKPDSISSKIPQKIVSEDTTFLHYMKSPWQMRQSTMNQFFHEDLGDLLIYFPGNYLIDMGISGQRLSLNRHGANAKQVSLFFDGRPIYDPIFGGIDLNFIPIEFTETIRVEQELSSSFVTSSAEMVSLKSSSYEEDTPYSRVSYHKAPYGYSDIDAIFGQRVSRKTTILLGGIIKSYDGKTSSQSFEQQNFRGKIDYQLSPSWQFKYSWISNKINRKVPNPVFADTSYQLTDASQKVSRFDQTLNIKGRIFNSDFKNFYANIYYSSLLDKLKDENFEPNITNQSRYAGFNFQIQNLLLGQRITSGGDFTHEWIDADQVDKNNQTFGSIFIQDDWEWKERFGIRILGNYKLNSVHNSQFSGGLSSYFSLVKNVKITAAAKQSLRYPTFFEMDAKTNYIGNPALQPESHKKIELGAEWQIEPKFSLTSALYHKKIGHAIQFNPVDSLKATFLNQNEIQYSGFDVQLKWNFLSQFKLMTLFSMIDNSNLNDQPNIMLTGFLQYGRSLFQGDLKPTIRLEGRYFGKRNSIVSHPYFYKTYQQNIDPAFVLNAHAILDFGNLKIFITLENILDEKYELIYGYPMNERILHYGLRWEFWN